jgi:hypothetical protein
MNQKIPPEILSRQELALVGQAEVRTTLPYGGPCISFNSVFASLIHRLRPHDNHAINGEFGSLVKNARFPHEGLDVGRGAPNSPRRASCRMRLTCK